MVLVAMNWKVGQPPNDFVGFAIEYKEPGGDRFYAVTNRIAFPGTNGALNSKTLSTKLSPIQKFRWVHFPRNAELKGDFVYRVSPVFMNEADELSYGDPQEAALPLRRDTYPGQLNVAFTRGFVSSQAFVDRYGAKSIPLLLPAKAADGLGFKPSYAKSAEALAWMGFEARSAILELLEQAIVDPTAEVRVIAYDLNDPEIVSRLVKLGARLRIIVDDSDDHGEAGSAESMATQMLVTSAGTGQVKRQHMGGLQHNKTIIVSGAKMNAAIAGSTNFSWRGMYVQNNNALIVHGPEAVRIFTSAFEAFWASSAAAAFGATTSAGWQSLGFKKIGARVTFSPRSKANAVLASIADDMEKQTTSSLFFSLAFLSQTSGAIRGALTRIQAAHKIFSYGIADKAVKELANSNVVASGIELTKPDGTMTVVHPEELTRNLPAPFNEEPTGGSGIRMHHKFLVIDFNKPTARVYVGSFNFSVAADLKNGENLLCIRDRRVATSYMIEALRIFDHYHFRVATAEAAKAGGKFQLALPPRKPGDVPWWTDSYTNPTKIRDRELFA